MYKRNVQPQAIKPPASTSQLKDFEFLGKLGQGSFGVVYKVRRKVDGNQYVMKQINISKMNSRMKADAINEVTILNKLNHQNIVKYYDSFIERNLLNIVMEFCEGGDLNQLIKSQFGRPLKEDRIWKYFILMTMGLEYIHKRKILHRDMKTMNVFLQKDDMRIGDLGVAKVLQENMDFARTMVGTPFYLSPEMCEEKPYNEKSDIWALGCILYELCTYKHPFEAKTQGALVLKIIRGKYAPVSSHYSKDLIEMVDLLLRRDYRSRPNATQILQKSSIQKKAESLNINLNPGSIDKKLEYVKKPKEGSSQQAAKPSSTNNIKKQDSNQKIRSIQSQIVVEKNKKPVSNSNLDQKNANLKYKDPTKEQNLKKANYHYQQQQNKKPLVSKDQDEVDIQKHRQMMLQKDKEKLQKQREKLEQDRQNLQKYIQKPPPGRPGGPREANQKPIHNAYHDKAVNDQRKSSQEPVNRQNSNNNQPKIKSGAFNQSPSVNKQQQQQQQKPPQTKQAYPFQKQSNILSKKNSVSNAKPAVNQQPARASVSTHQAQQVKGVGYQKRSSERDLKDEDKNLKFPFKQDDKKVPSSEKLDSERGDVGRIRKGAPQQLSRQAQQAANLKPPTQQKQLFGADQNRNDYLGKNHPAKKPTSAQNLKPSVPSSNKNSQRQLQAYEEDEREEVLNLPDNVRDKQKDDRKISPMVQQQQQQKKTVDDEQEREREKIFGRKLHDPNEKIIVKMLDDHFEKEAKEKEQKEKQGQQVVSDKFVEDEFNTSSSDEDNKNKKKSEPLEKSQELSGKFQVKKQPMDLKGLMKKEKEEDESTQVNQTGEDDEEETEDQEFTVQSNLEQQQQGDENEEQGVVESNEEEGEGEDNQDEEEDDEYYDEEEEEKQSYEEGEEDAEEEEEEDSGSLKEVSDDEREQDEEIDEEEQDFKSKTVEVQKILLQKKFDDTKKRQNELQQLLDIKTKQCEGSLGPGKFQEILSFFKKKLNSEQDFSNEDQEEIDRVIQKHVMDNQNPQLIYTIYKILHLEIELDKQKEKATSILKKLEANEGK